MFAQKKNNHIAYCLVLSVCTLILVVAGYWASPPNSFTETFFFALGGKMPEGLIQGAIYFCFFLALFGVDALNARLRREHSIYSARLLPETEQYVLYPEDVNQIKLRTIEAERHLGPSMITDLIKQAATKFRSNHSPADALAMVETVSDMQRKAFEREFWLINTCQNLIPALGFLGTVLGMAAAILNMGEVRLMAQASPTTGAVAAAVPQTAIGAADISMLIDNLGTAFFTTILSIVLGIIVSIVVKRTETRVEDFLTGSKRYVVENLVNRIHL